MANGNHDCDAFPSWTHALNESLVIRSGRGATKGLYAISLSIPAILIFKTQLKNPKPDIVGYLLEHTENDRKGIELVKADARVIIGAGR